MTEYIKKFKSAQSAHPLLEVYINLAHDLNEKIQSEDYRQLLKLEDEITAQSGSSSTCLDFVQALMDDQKPFHEAGSFSSRGLAALIHGQIYNQDTVNSVPRCTDAEVKEYLQCLKALSLRQSWALAIMSGQKDVEYRIVPLQARLPCLVAIHSTTVRDTTSRDRDHVPIVDAFLGLALIDRCSFVAGRYAWHVTQRWSFHVPLPCAGRGQRGIWQVPKV
eukprot:symbB.v1.2.024547.t1/scaffold2329.1/size82184/1